MAVKINVSKNPDTMMLELGNKRMKEGGAEDDIKPYFGGAGTKKYAAAKKRAEQADVNLLKDPKTYAAVAGLLGEAPDEMGFSVMHPDYQGIKEVADPAFYTGTALGVAPLAKALKAPTMALGKAGEKYAEKVVPRIMERGGLGADILGGLTQGARSNLDVWHGSPHKFPPTAKNPLGEFDPTKMGTGEGAQAYGIGHYTAEAKDVAKTYQPRSPEYEEKLLGLYDKAQRQSNYPMMEVLEDAMLHRDPEEILTKFANIEDGYTPQHIKAAKDFAKWYEKNPPEVGGLYKVDLSDEAILKMLDLDKPLSEQSESVKAVLLNHPDVLEHIAKSDQQRMRLNESHPVRLEKIPSAANPYDATRMTGSDVMSAIAQRSGMGERGAVEKQLKELGIPGIKYLDEGSRGATGSGKWQITNKDGTTSIMDFKPNDDVLESMGATASPYGTRNFVVFPGNEDLMNIIDRKKSGGKVSISNNPNTMMLELGEKRMKNRIAVKKPIKKAAGGDITGDDLIIEERPL